MNSTAGYDNALSAAVLLYTIPRYLLHIAGFDKCLPAKVLACVGHLLITLSSSVQICVSLWCLPAVAHTKSQYITRVD